MISKLDLLSELESTLESVQGVILTYSELNEFPDNYFNSYTSRIHIYGVNEMENKFFKWSLQITAMIEALENGFNVAPNKRDKLLNKLSNVNRQCVNAMQGVNM